jgi:hypothetical protein
MGGWSLVMILIEHMALHMCEAHRVGSWPAVFYLAIVKEAAIVRFTKS